ncbi:MAG TPA: c-type cytochrome [Methylotenera sp.]|nr:c-type cytochrome [Methylotenera sp.]
MKFRNFGVIALFSMFSIAVCAAGNAKTVGSATLESKPTQSLEIKSDLKKIDAIQEKVVVAAADDSGKPAVGADGFPLPSQKVKSTAAEIKPLGSDKSPHDVATNAAKGTLKNPYSYSTMDPALVEAGKKKYMSVSCNGCHGGNGGGGMCPPLSNETWVYGADDDTLFRLVALGSDELLKQGYTRKGRENVVGPMPAHGKILKTEDDLWRIIYFIRGNFRGDAKNISW